MNESRTNESIIKQVRDYLFRNFLFGYDENEFDNNLSFLELGILDSTGIMELVSFIEKEFSIEVLDNEIIPENLDTVNIISSFVMKKLSK